MSMSELKFFIDTFFLGHPVYIPLVAELSKIYRSYKFEIVPIVVGTLGAVPDRS